MDRRILAIAALAVTTPFAARAQANPLVGKWEIEFPGPVRIENGDVQVTPARGTLEIRQQGDSLIATLTVAPMEGMPPRPPSRMAAAAANGSATFVSKTQARMNFNGEETVHEIVNTWALHAAGDALDGTLARSGPADMPGFGGPPGAVKGSRAK